MNKDSISSENIIHAHLSRMTKLLEKKGKRGWGNDKACDRYQRREYWGAAEHSGSSQAFCCWSREMNNQSWVSRSVCSHLPISNTALCTTTAHWAHPNSPQEVWIIWPYALQWYPPCLESLLSVSKLHIVRGIIYTYTHNIKQMAKWATEMYTIL